MNWYYAEAGQQIGPITEEELFAMAASGKIRSDTLVWREGMANWQVYDTVKPAGAPPSPAPPGPAPVMPGQVPCVECGKIVSQDNAVAYEGNWVCANCKPVYFQKLREGAALPVPPGEMRYGGFWIRFAAKFVDRLILGVVMAIPAVILMAGYFTTATRGRTGPGAFSPFAIGMPLLINLAEFVLFVLYNWFFLSKYSSTPGKMACGLKVVTSAGQPLTSRQALGRAASEIVSQLTCAIGYIIAAFDDQKRALHDHLANTRVIKK